jgi:hypothetical protein
MTPVCATNSTCLPRRCRRDLYTLRSAVDALLGPPPLCNGSSYCPDDGSGCAPLLALGATCELDRDGGYRILTMRRE